jgi:hypothetical protein
MSARDSLKSLFIKYMPDTEAGRIILNLPKIRKFDFSSSIFFDDKHRLYDYINEKIIAGGPVSYLEFGVYTGGTILYWTKLNKNKDSEFVGFDTFTGLPEDWQNLSGTMRKNHFDTNGKTPDIADPRCSFVKGLFQDTLPGFLNTFKPKGRLVIHNDSDLYTSSLYTLAKLHPFLTKGTIIIFDEFSAPLHEMRAFSDFTTSHLVKYKMLAHTHNYTQVALEIL